MHCEGKAAYGYAATALDATTFVLSLVCALMLVKWSKYLRRGHRGWYRDDVDRSLDNPEFVDEAGLAVIVPGQAHVYKVLVFIGLFVLLISAILLIIFTIFIHDFRERWFRNESGWPRENSRLRLAATIIGTVLVILSLVPYPHRVYHYLIAFAFFCTAVMFFVAFGIDVRELSKARDLPCHEENNSGLYCIYHPYNTVCVFDFLCGLLIVIYLLVEFLAHKKKSMVAAREYAYTDDVGIDDFGIAPRIPGEAAKSLTPIPLPLAPLRPVIGVEVLEVQGMDGQIRLSVSGVTPGSAADEAGLRIGDIITRWDDFPIHTKADFARAVQDAHIGSTALIQVERQAPTGLGGYMTGIQDFLRLTIRGVPV